MKKNTTLSEYLCDSKSLGVRRLVRSGITSVDQIVGMTERELIRASDLHVCRSIIDKLSQEGLSLRKTEIEQVLNLPYSIISVLEENGIEKIQELTQATEEDLLCCYRIGEKKLALIKKALEEVGLESSRLETISLAKEYGISNCNPELSLDALGLPYYVRRCLKKAGIFFINDLLQKTKPDLLSVPGMLKGWLNYVYDKIKILSDDLNDTSDLICSVPKHTIQLDSDIEKLDLPVRAYNCLDRSNINTVGELLEKTEAEVLAINNLGDVTLQDIKNVLGRYGFILKSDSAELKKEVKRQHRVAAKKQLTLAEETLTKGVKQLKKALQMLEAVPEINSEIDLAKIELLIGELEVIKLTIENPS